MSTKLLILALVPLCATTISFANGPAGAETFATNVKIVNASTSQKQKLLDAQAHVRRVVASDEFRDSVLNHTYSGKKTFNYNNGMTNEEIYEAILDGAEALSPSKNNAMDLEVELYYNRWTSTVGYTYETTKRIFQNTKFFNSYTSEEVAGNLFHEWLHKLGFDHQSSYSTSRDYTVPYALGYLMEKLAKQDLGQASLVPATNVKLAKSGTTVKLTWTAATSPEGIETYKVFRRLSGSTTNYLQGTTTSLSFSQTAPSKNAVYYVRAVDTAGETAKSSEVSYTN
jgi:hypothetical protein